MEVFASERQLKGWTDLAYGRPADLSEIMQGYKASVDWPSCAYYKDLMTLYPDAKVLLTERDSEAWYKSASATIFKAMQLSPEEGDNLGRKLIFQDTFNGDFGKENAIRIFQKHNQEVKEYVPADKLLVYQVGDGWQPLCDFLELPEPEEEFPRVNSTEEFEQRFFSAVKD